MPSLPSLPSSPYKTDGTMLTNKAGPKYREAVYHQDGRGQCVAQSYEVRPQSTVSSPTEGMCKQTPNPYKRSSKAHAVVIVEPDPSRKSTEISSSSAESHDTLQRSSSRSYQDRVSTTESAPPPAPRPRRLPTPELSDIDDERPFCECDLKKSAKCCLLCAWGTF